MIATDSGTVLIFDFFGVVCSEIAPFWLAERVPYDEALRIKATLIHEADCGSISQDEMFRRLGDLVGSPASLVEQEWWDLVRIDTDVVELIVELRKHHRVGLLTNSPAEFVRAIIRRFDLTRLFDVIVVSSEIGAIKPSPEPFMEILSRLSSTAQTSLFIDDNPANVAASEAVGMLAIRYQSIAQLRSDLASVLG